MRQIFVSNNLKRFKRMSIEEKRKLIIKIAMSIFGAGFIFVVGIFVFLLISTDNMFLNILKNGKLGHITNNCAAIEYISVKDAIANTILYNNAIPTSTSTA